MVNSSGGTASRRGLDGIRSGLRVNRGPFMHKFTMPPQVLERVIKRRGKRHAYDALVAQKTALIVIDLQNAFMLPGVAHALCDAAQQVVPNVNRLAEVVRRDGGTVVWIRTSHTEQSLREWSCYYESLSTPAAKQKRIEALTPGSIGHDFWPELAIDPADLVVDKARYSAFIQGSSSLERQLRARGIDTVLITGTVTNVCCESTARDAMMLNFKTIMVSDGNAAANDQEHANSLVAFYLNFGDVQTTDEVIGHLQAAEQAPAAVSA
jgi:ureidoacrylate peracid hydrolase